MVKGIIPIYKTKYYESYHLGEGRIAELERLKKGEWSLWVSNTQIGSTDTKKVLMKRLLRLAKRRKK